jgi:hypothetical protein
MFPHQDNKSEKTKKIEELYYEEKKKTWKNEIEYVYSKIGKVCNIGKVYDAFKSDGDAFLFICTIIIPEDIKQRTPKVIKTYFFGKSIPYLEPITKEAGDIGKLRDNWKKLETELKDLNKIMKRGRYFCRWLHRDKPILPKDLNEIRERGKDIYRWLLGAKPILPNNLSNARSGMGGIWIFCAAKEVEPIWEWLCPETNDGEFLGDEFCIVRIHDDCKIEDNCQVGKELIILGDKTRMDSPHTQLESVCKQVNKSTVLVDKFNKHPLGETTSPESIRNRVICNMTDIDDTTVNTFFEETIYKKSNILLSHPCRQLLYSNQSPIIWVDSRFDIPKEQAMYFVKCFCEVLGEHSINPEKVRVAKIVTETREKMKNGSNIHGLWRLAFVVNGNPKTTLT